MRARNSIHCWNGNTECRMRVRERFAYRRSVLFFWLHAAANVESNAISIDVADGFADYLDADDGSNIDPYDCRANFAYPHANAHAHYCRILLHAISSEYRMLRYTLYVGNHRRWAEAHMHM